MLPATAEWHTVLNRTTWTCACRGMEREKPGKPTQSRWRSCLWGEHSGLRPMGNATPGKQDWESGLVLVTRCRADGETAGTDIVRKFHAIVCARCLVPGSETRSLAAGTSEPSPAIGASGPPMVFGGRAADTSACALHSNTERDWLAFSCVTSWRPRARCGTF